ncbi:Petrobactin import system permease protein YclN [Rhodopseudomonas palustris]|uniref:Iron chelate uptake ABC transporter family permease subunit n=1 Tax=Rhodopseudomonas palustris (strain ATCC BAA-98 / CGA009) TaxID=258594 RepID=Q6N776_RHOPA|nr:iron chelate uptake ABC transporter family permease subunit [Rhodopseudomonas palustris]ACF01137.1 transport system permease protein [Rhodopseudomonas palustris TIE-1]OPF90357.1 iron ABC transporter permease [Rhodopseudomonas palustris]QQM03902.1 Petrobactin import system permease protein YclN [Rhodopseudomonas palustris]RJF61960.1 ABC transporter permease [Rhodopseudomonas palustris]WAB80037.1 iron chelate uptake ABC transporter family permease subunit [Rhodopseudomonas palustris]
MIAVERTASRSAGATALLALVALFVVSIFVGVGEVAPRDVFTSPDALYLVVASRLPRTLAAVLTGAGLAIAGLVMQTLARNRFVEPTTAGTGQSAALGILLVALLLPSASIATKTLVASLTALAGTSLFLAIAHRLPPTQPFLVPLFGLVYGGVVGAAVTFVAWHTDLLQFIEIWTNGEFSGVLRGRYELLWASAAVLAMTWVFADRLTLMSLGRDVSVGLGLDYARMMQIGLLIISIVTALTVVIVGMIPFVGLVVPNMVSRLIGDNMRSLIPWVAGSGAALVLACDIIGRLLHFPYEIPVGTVLGVVGAASFLWLLLRRPSHA